MQPQFLLNDPFIVLMDDHFDIGDRAMGEPHAHAGFETVTLLLDGAIYDSSGTDPLIGDSKEDIVRLLAEYRAGQFVRMSELARQDG